MTYPMPSMPQAACHGDLLFTDDRHAKDSKAICGFCPEQTKCLDYAIHVDVAGVWGGTQHRERKRMRAKAGIQVEHLPAVEHFLPGPSRREVRLAQWEKDDIVARYEDHGTGSRHSPGHLAAIARDYGISTSTVGWLAREARALAANASQAS